MRLARAPWQVQVYEDPVYGTAVFETLSGMSMCPHEDGTLAREGFKATVPQVRCGAGRVRCDAMR